MTFHMSLREEEKRRRRSRKIIGKRKGKGRRKGRRRRKQTKKKNRTKEEEENFSCLILQVCNRKKHVLLTIFACYLLSIVLDMGCFCFDVNK